ncbi:MAG: YaeQ family protein [Acidobacteriota bacterium]|nr:YaeQ family protein [Acidobacteriota bacterium]
MALTATIYNLVTELADVDRGVYETFDLRMGRHPSETQEYLLTRYLAYCLEYTEGITFATGGVSSADEPAVLVRDPAGRVTAWIEVGMPDARRLHRGMKLAGRAAVYTHRHVEKVLEELRAGPIHRAADIPVYAFDRDFIDSAAAAIGRRAVVAVSITERQLYLDIDGRHFGSAIVAHRIA